MRLSWLLCGALTCGAVSGCEDQADKSSAPRAYAIDGDTIIIDGKPHDLAGIDAPELGQRCENESRLYDCGKEAGFALAKLIVLDHPECTESGDIDAFHCATPIGNLAEILLDQGHVTASPDSPEAYRSRQKLVAEEGIGLWRGAFISPERWRDGERLISEKNDPRKCAALGFDEDDAKVYVTPTHPDYTDLRKRHEDSSRRFCSDEEARSAGYIWRVPTNDG